MAHSELKSIDWIFFDLDGTLWDHESACQEAILAVCTRYGLAPMSFIPLFRETNLHMWGELERGRATFEELRVRRFEMALGQLGCGCSPVDTLEMSHHYNEVYSRKPYPMPGLQEALTAASRHGRLGIVTNAPRIVQENKVRHLAMPEGAIEFMLCAGDTPWLKPDERFFAEARKRAGNPDPERILFVGDSWEGDILTPLALGWQTAWLSHGREVPEKDKACLVCENLVELTKVLNAGIVGRD